jgi:hypothetical protein
MHAGSFSATRSGEQWRPPDDQAWRLAAVACLSIVSQSGASPKGQAMKSIKGKSAGKTKKVARPKVKRKTRTTRTVKSAAARLKAHAKKTMAVAKKFAKKGTKTKRKTVAKRK